MANKKLIGTQGYENESGSYYEIEAYVYEDGSEMFKMVGYENKQAKFSGASGRILSEDIKKISTFEGKWHFRLDEEKAMISKSEKKEMRLNHDVQAMLVASGKTKPFPNMDKKEEQIIEEAISRNNEIIKKAQDELKTKEVTL